MLNLKSEKLQIRCKTNADYLAFISFANDFQSRTKKEYDFLCISDTAWDNLFNTGLEKFSEGKIKDFSGYIKRYIERYIKNEYDNKKFRIFHNLLIKLKKEQSPNLLSAFLEKLKNWGIKLNEEYYCLLINEIPIFKELLSKNYLNTYEEFEKYFNGEYDIYYDLKNRNHTLQETIQIVNYFVSLIPKFTIKKLQSSKDTLKYKKIKYLIANYQYLEKIYELYQNKFGVVPKAIIDKTILTFTLDEISELFNELHRYCYIDESNKNDSFLHRIYNRLKNINSLLESSPKKSSKPILISENDTKENEDKPKTDVAEVAIEQNLTEELSVEEILKQLNTNERFIASFPDYEGIILEQKTKLIGNLLESEDKKEAANLYKYMNGKIKGTSKEGKRAKYFLRYTLRRKYKKMVDEHLNPTPLKSIYDYFPDYEGITREQKIELVNEMLAKEDKEYVQTLYRFITKDPQINPLITKKMSYYLNSTLRKKYQKQVEEVHKAPLKKSISTYFLDYEGISLKRKQEIIDELLKNETKEQLEKVLEYFSGKIPENSLEGSQISKYLQNISRKYKRFVINELKSPAEVSIYFSFPDYEGITNEQKKEIIDELLKKEPEERVINLLKYINGEFKNDALNRKRMYYYLYNGLLKKYRIIVEKELNQTADFSVYNLFPNHVLVTTEEKQDLINALIKRLPLSRQLNLYAFLKNEESDIDRAKKDLYNLKRKYPSLIDRYFISRDRYINKDKVLYIAEIVKNLIKRDLFPSLNISKILLLNDELKLIEYQYRTKNNISKEQYLNYLAQKIEEIITINPDYDLEQLITTYITITYQALMPKEDIPKNN